MWGRVMQHEMQRVRNESELGIIVQLQQAAWDHRFIHDFGWDISDMSSEYEGENAVRAMPEITQINEGESFEQKVIFLGNGAITNPQMYYREIGSSDPFASVALTPTGSSENIMTASLDHPGYDFEYYIQGAVGADTVTYPVTGGNETSSINKSVITVERVAFEGQELQPLGPIIDDTSIPAKEDAVSLVVYPNPVTDQLCVETTDRVEEIRVYSILGELLLQDMNPKGIVSMNSFTKGIYIIEVKTNGQIFFSKVIKR